MKNQLAFAAIAAFSTAGLIRAQDATIHVQANEIVSRPSRFLTGACLEDVNHEVYGGLYSQMIFGESFQEPALPPPIENFTAYGGHWSVRDGVVSVDEGPGPKLIANRAEFAVGEAGVDVFLPGKARGVAGLIVRVQQPRTGPDAFVGYEIALSAEPQFLRLGRHRNNWEHIKDVPCRVAAETWIALVVRLTETSLEITVDGKSILKYEDHDHPLGSGKIGLRAFNRACRFRNLWVKTGDQQTPLAFSAARRWDEGVSAMWRGLRRGTATGRYELETQHPFIGRQSQRLTFVEGQGEIGIENRGLNRWGMYFVERKPYEGRVWLRAQRPSEVIAALETGDGSRVLAHTRLMVQGGNEWQRFPFTLSPNATEKSGRFAIKLDRLASVDIGYAFLEPGSWARFKDLPVRKDVAEALVAQGLTVLRYGGSMVNTTEYRWKKMIGLRDRRPPYHGTWYPYSSNGWGIVDFVAFCEAAGFLAVPAFNMDETPQDMADFVEYMNGPADSVWGLKRVADGHAAPYQLQHLELGNEEAINEPYWKRFQPLAEAIWAKDPHIIIVVGDFAYNGRIKDPFNFPGAPSIKSLAAHQKILEFAKAHGRPVWFDVHVWNHEPRDPAGLRGGIIGLSDFAAALKKLCPEADFKVCVFEENAVNHTQRRGLGHAHAINRLERLGDLVPIVCAANCLQPVGQNDNGWDQGLLFLSPAQVWGQPSYYVTQMVSRNYLPQCVRADVKSTGDALDVTAKRSEDGKLLQLQVVNLDGKPVKTGISISGFAPAMPIAQVLEIRGQLNDDNTPDNPKRIAPVERRWGHEFEDGRLDYVFPAHSFTMLRFN